MRTSRTLLLATALSFFAFPASTVVAQDLGAGLGTSMATASNRAMLQAMQYNHRGPWAPYPYRYASSNCCNCPAPPAIVNVTPPPAAPPATTPPLPQAQNEAPAANAPQDSNPAPSQPASQPAKPTSAILPCGTFVRLVFVSQASSKTAQVGDSLELRVAEDINLGGILLVPKGSPADASITFVSHTGPGGIPGQLAFELNAMRVNNTTVPLWRANARAGDPKMPGPAILIPVAGMFTMFRHGKDAEIKSGTPLTAFVTVDTVVPLQP